MLTAPENIFPSDRWDEAVALMIDMVTQMDASQPPEAIADEAMRQWLRWIVPAGNA